MSNWGLILTLILQWKQHRLGSFLSLQRIAYIQDVSGDQTASRGLPSTFPQLLLGEWARTVDSGPSDLSARYCIMGVLAQPDPPSPHT